MLQTDDLIPKFAHASKVLKRKFGFGDGKV
jgi:hypothetical protein